MGTSIFAGGDANITQINGASTAGNNATLYLKQLNITNSADTAFIAQSTGGNGVGAIFKGNGSGPGLYCQADVTGSGLLADGGSVSGHGLWARGLAIGSGLVGSATGADGDGINCTAANGSGGYFESKNGGSVAGSGIAAIGSATAADSHGLFVKANGTNGSGIAAFGKGTGDGAIAVAGATGSGWHGSGGTGGGGFNGTMTQGWTRTAISTDTTTTPKSASGFLHAVVVKLGATTTGSIVVYDNTAGSGTILATIDSTTAVGNGTFIFDCTFATGLTLVTTAVAGAAEINVFWR